MLQSFYKWKFVIKKHENGLLDFNIYANKKK